MTGLSEEIGTGARPRLAVSTLDRLSADVAVPNYDRAEVSRGIVHLGVGAFHRAHQALVVDDCLGAGAPDWGIVGASLRSAETRDALGAQDGLYSLSVVDGSGERLRVVGSLLELMVAPEDPAALLDVLTDPAVRIVSLTVTEKAYLRDASGHLDLTHPDLRWDLDNPAEPRTVHGYLAEAIDRRRAAGTPPFTILSCDNLPANGRTLRRLLVAYAAQRDAALGRFVEDRVAFPSSMVDRIVPATTAEDRERISQALGAEDRWPVTTEPFLQWVVEDHFPTGRPAWEHFGVEMVADVGPFEDMKLRMLNGAHSAIAYLGLLTGGETVAQAFANPAIRQFVSRLWAEAAPTLPMNAGLNIDAYTHQLTARFDNPALKHRTAQIANDGSQKLPQRIVATAIERLDKGDTVEHLTLVPAAWIVAAEGRGRTLPQGHFTDPLDTALTEIFGRDRDAAATTDAVFAAAGFAVGSTHREHLVRSTGRHVDALRRAGVAVALEGLGS